MKDPQRLLYGQLFLALYHIHAAFPTAETVKTLSTKTDRLSRLTTALGRQDRYTLPETLLLGLTTREELFKTLQCIWRTPHSEHAANALLGGYLTMTETTLGGREIVSDSGIALVLALQTLGQTQKQIEVYTGIPYSAVHYYASSRSHSGRKKKIIDSPEWLAHRPFRPEEWVL